MSGVSGFPCTAIMRCKFVQARHPSSQVYGWSQSAQWPKWARSSALFLVKGDAGEGRCASRRITLPGVVSKLP